MLSFSCVRITDRVFRFDSTTKQVYDEGAKEVALSVLSGINGEFHSRFRFPQISQRSSRRDEAYGGPAVSASIFAYGQTSSGKTYTMTGITELAMGDIYDYIQRVRNFCSSCSFACIVDSSD